MLKEKLIYQSVGRELIIFDEASGKAHSFPENYSWVINQIRGGSTLEEMAEAGSLQFQWDDGRLTIEAALSDLAEKGLLQHSCPQTSRLSRRNFVAALGATVAILTPLPSAAASANGGVCVPINSTHQQVCEAVGNFTGAGTQMICEISFHAGGSGCALPGAMVNIDSTAQCALNATLFNTTADVCMRAGPC